MGLGCWFSGLLGVPGEPFCRLDMPSSRCPSHGFIATTLFPRSISRYYREPVELSGFPACFLPSLSLSKSPGGCVTSASLPLALILSGT